MQFFFINNDSFQSLNIIRIHTIVVRDWQYYAKYYQSHKILLWICITLGLYFLTPTQKLERVCRRFQTTIHYKERVRKQYKTSKNVERLISKRTWFWVPLVRCSKTCLDQDNEGVNYKSHIDKIVRVCVEFEFLPSEILMFQNVQTTCLNILMFPKCSKMMESIILKL